VTFYEALENAAGKITAQENFGLTATYTVAATSVSSSILAVIHQPRTMPYQDLTERKITNDGYMHSVNVNRGVKAVFQKGQQESNFAIIQFLVSDIAAPQPKDTILINGETWEII